MRKPGTYIRFLLAIMLLFSVEGTFLTYASEDLRDTLQTDGRLNLIVKFKDFAADRIKDKLDENEAAIEDDLNEYILKKIDEKYNLNKLKKLFRAKELARTSGGFAEEFDDYFVIEIGRDEENAEWICSALERFYEIDMAEVDRKLSIEAVSLPDTGYIPNDYYVSSDNVYWREGAWGQSYPDMWGLQKIQAFESWALFANARTDPGKDVVVAVIDTGVDFSHPDVGANKWVNPDEIAGNGSDDDGNGYVDDTNGWDFVNNDSNPYDDHGHGTHCAGTIAGVTNNSAGVASVAPNARIMAVKGLGSGGSGSISGLSNCILYAANNGADVLSNSWGGEGSSSTLANAVSYAYSRGCVVVAAAGNGNKDAASNIPSSYANVIAVAATDNNDIRASFSNYGTSVDVSAPGVNVMSTTGGTYKSWSGTSMACPHVSGLAALILSKDPALTNAQVAQRIKDTTDNIDSQNPSYRGLLGTGRINAYKAIQAGGPVTHAPVLASIGNKTINEGQLLSFTVSATDADGDGLIYSAADLPGGLTKSGDGNFFVQSDTVYAGTRALQSGEIGENKSCAVSKTVSFAASGTVSFYWKVSSAQNSGRIAFYIDDVQKSEISGETAWEKKTFSVTSGSHTFKWAYSKDNGPTAGKDTGWIDNIAVSSGTGASYDFEDGKMPSGFTTGGNGTFYVRSGTAYTGSYAMTADPSITDNQYEYVQKTVTAASNAQLSFWWKVSSEYYYDFLEFYIDNVLQNRISGSTSWVKKTYTLNAGNHTLKWQYIKDYSVTTGEDTGWVDDIVLTGGQEETIDFEPKSGEPNPLPKGASFDEANRTFTWTPTFQQAGVYTNIRFIVTEATAEARSDYEEITITVADMNNPPVLDPIGDKTVNEMELLEFTVSASDPENDTLAYSAANLPNGAVFDAITRKFSWRPTYQQSGVYKNVRFEVTDGGTSGGGIDANTKLLLHLNGANNSTQFTDSSQIGHTVTAYDGAKITTANIKWGTGALELRGCGYDDHLTVADHGAWDIQTNFTIDLWVRHEDIDGAYQKMEAYVGHREYGVGTYHFMHSGTKGLSFEALTANGTYISLSGGLIQDTGWHHVALVKVGSNWGIYQDGRQVAYAQGDMATNFSAPLWIGAISVNNGYYYFDGQMDEIRISHSNPFNASPNSGCTNTIRVPTGEYTQGAQVSGNVDSEEITITVIDVNNAPVLRPIGIKGVSEGELLEFTVTAADVNGDALTYSASNLPTGAVFNAASRKFSWTPTSNQAGLYSGVHFEVTDGKLTDSENITITVFNVNAAPVLAYIGNKIINENTLLQFAISATDADGDALTYSAANLPAGASFNSATRTFSWTPTYSDAGTYTVTFTVSDGSKTDEESITITVIDVNRKPVISNLTINPPSAAIKEGEEITITISASDADGDSLSYNAQNQPEDSGFVNNVFTWTPGYDQAGIYSDITLTAFDGKDYSDPSASVTITVTNLKDAPAFITEPKSIASYDLLNAAKEIALKDNTAYVANGQDGLKAFDIKDITAITETDTLSIYNELGKLYISGNYCYVIDSGTLVGIVSITDPSSLYSEVSIVEGAAQDIGISGNTMYIMCNSEILLYDIADKANPSKIEGIDLGKGSRIEIEGDYGYVISAEEELKAIDIAANTALSQILGGLAEDIAVRGRYAYVAKGTTGITAYDVEDPENPETKGVFSKSGTAVKKVSAATKNRLFALGYNSGNNAYVLMLLNTDNALNIAELQSYAFGEGTVVNAVHPDGNRALIAGEDKIEIIAFPLEDTYTIEEGKTLKITIYAKDPDNEDVAYTINNKPGFNNCVFTDNNDGTATLTWTPAQSQIGIYSNITFTASDPYQEAVSGPITITVTAQDVIGATPIPIDENTKLMLHLNGNEGSKIIVDSSPSNHTVITPFNSAAITCVDKKFGAGSLVLTGRSYQDYVALPDSPDWDIKPEFTIDLWARHKNIAGSYMQTEEYISQREQGVGAYHFFYSASRGLAFECVGGTGNTVNMQGGAINDSLWHHIALVKTGSAWGIYLDGAQVAYFNGEKSTNFSAEPWLGSISVGGGYYFLNGNMDEIRISHKNIFNASPNSSLTNRIRVPSDETE